MNKLCSHFNSFYINHCVLRLASNTKTSETSLSSFEDS